MKCYAWSAKQSVLIEIPVLDSGARTRELTRDPSTREIMPPQLQVDGTSVFKVRRQSWHTRLITAAKNISALGFGAIYAHADLTAEG
jgi:hypothetical protein